MIEAKMRDRKVDYYALTEAPGMKATKEQLKRLYHRYRFAAEYCNGKDVIEVACGTGIGLSYLSNFARSIFGGDVDVRNVDFAAKLCRDKKNCSIGFMDAQALPLDEDSVDVVLFYEAIYYLPSAEKFVLEAYRVLHDGGVLIMCTVNKNWKDFHPSPHSKKYFSAQELDQLLSRTFQKVDLYGAYPTVSRYVKEKIISLFKQWATKLHLIPKTLKGREWLKRIFFGSLVYLPADLSTLSCEYDNPVLIRSKEEKGRYKILYVVSTKNVKSSQL